MHLKNQWDHFIHTSFLQSGTFFALFFSKYLAWCYIQGTQNTHILTVKKERIQEIQSSMVQSPRKLH